MRERRKVKVNGEMLPVITLEIKRAYYPPAALTAIFPTPPKGLSKAELEKWMGETSGKVDEANAAAREKWLKERVPDTHIRIEFMAWAWEGREIGEIGGEHIKSIDGGELDEACRLRLPDGRVIHGRTVDLPNDRICANAAILGEERASGIPQGRIDERLDRIERTVDEIILPMRNKMGEMIKGGLKMWMEVGRKAKLDEKELLIFWAMLRTKEIGSRAATLMTEEGTPIDQSTISRRWPGIMEKLFAIGYVFEGKESAQVYEKSPDGSLTPKREGYNRDNGGEMDA